MVQTIHGLNGKAHRLASVILAAGQGTRMKSKKAKVLHEVGGKPMVTRAVEAAVQAGTLIETHLRPSVVEEPLRPVVVVGRDSEQVRAVLGERAEYVEQGELLGTGHAVLQAANALRGRADQPGDIVLVTYADMPLLQPETLYALHAFQRAASRPISMLTVTVQDPRGFGRIVRREDGSIAAIVEEKECTPEQLRIRELNPGVYAFDAAWLWANLPKLTPKSKGEYYLTDLIEIAAVAFGPEASAVASINFSTPDELDELIGINTRVHLAEAEAALRRRVTKRLMLAGVTITDPATAYISEDADIGPDTVILPNTHIAGRTDIGPDCVIGPNTVIVESKIGAGCTVDGSVVEYATLEDDVHIGPFAHLRKGAYLETGVHMGNFGEVKNSRLGRGTRMGHFSYVGDAVVGADVNLGAGMITCNFDGERKHQTVIGDGAFIGSDTMLVAPVTVGAGGRTGAGAVVTRDVPPGQIAVGVPARNRTPQGQPIKDEAEYK
jgi:bifunctional UDP-N-acetylglucosamine pyrophosphorylase/glucosamine-1-phosphate N-acetyltransferase